MKASYLLLLVFLFAAFVQCSNELLENKKVQNEDSFDDPDELIEYLKTELAAKASIHVAELENENKPQYPLPPLKLIRNKFDNLTQFAGGALIGESIRNGNITFARIVTHLMIADQFPPQSNWVDILTKYRGDESELDELVQEIEIFEDFVKNNDISYYFDDNVAEKLVEFISNFRIIRRMAKQNEVFEEIMEKIELLYLEKSVGNKNYARYAVSDMTILDENSSLKIDSVDEMFRQLELIRKVTSLANSIYFFDTIPPLANRTLHQQFLAMDHEKMIASMLGVDSSKVVTPKIRNETEKLPFDEFRNIFKLLEISKSSVKIISLAKIIANQKLVKAFDGSVQNISDATQKNVFSRSKLLQMFKRSKAFFDSGNFSKSQLYDVTINGIADIDQEPAYCPVIPQGDIAHWSREYIFMTEIFLLFFIQISFGVFFLLKIYQRTPLCRNPIETLTVIAILMNQAAAGRLDIAPGANELVDLWDDIFWK